MYRYSRQRNQRRTVANPLFTSYVHRLAGLIVSTSFGIAIHYLVSPVGPELHGVPGAFGQHLVAHTDYALGISHRVPGEQ
jgi:hypothetical protein